MFDDLVDEFLMALVPDHPVVVYVLPTMLVGAGLVLVADSVPYLALVIGVVLSLGLSVAYAQTNLYRESGGERSTADWVVVGVFLLVVGGAVVAEEVDAVAVGVSPIQFVGLTGLLAGASIVEWLLPAIRARF